ncbi:MAG: glycoside hydrolase family 3 C-terminal domain-containing protein [Chitinophagaceae bacterium]|nr:glycoside hydrolase family 3 C-terminal domain-containing protein [Chitinophagaceae bacterium]
MLMYSGLKKMTFCFLVFLLFSGTTEKAYGQFRLKDNKIQAKADSILAQMTLDEKIKYITGLPGAKINPIPRLGLKTIRMSDGPLGVKGQAEGDTSDRIFATAFPAGISMASTWNTRLIYEVGKAIGVESKYNGIDILLGPSLNIIRLPQNGRNFEYYSEDPYLTGRIGVNFVKGLQSKKVLADVKHYAANNTEFNRYKSNSILDSRTLHEIYLPAFEATVKEAGSATVMTAHNLLNGIHCSEDSFLLDTVLRQRWGFNGFIISDWNSNYEVVPALKYGVDIEMPRPQIMKRDSVLMSLSSGKATEKDIDEKVRRILYTCLYFGLYDDVQENREKPNADEHAKIALRVAEEGVVLLENKGQLLPLNKSDVKKIIIVGPNAEETPLYGGGAAGMKTTRSRSLVAGIADAVNRETEVKYLKWPETETAQQEIRNADVVIVALGFNAVIEGEAHDRPFSLPAEQVRLIDYVSTLNKNVVAVLYVGGSVNIAPWVEKVRGLVMAWYMGDATGHIVGEIIFGDINPSGKLPITIEKKWEDAPAFPYYDTFASEAGMPALFKKQYEKVNGPVSAGEMIDTKYGEGIFVGYRHFTTKNIEPLYPFGFGLSYTNFSISNLKASVQNNTIKVSATVKNTGNVKGAEVVQLYVGDDEASVERPLKELKRFEKVFLSPGQSTKVEFVLNERDLSFWDVTSNDWKAEPGYFTIYVGNSSVDNSNTTKIFWK